MGLGQNFPAQEEKQGVFGNLQPILHQHPLKLILLSNFIIKFCLLEGQYVYITLVKRCWNRIILKQQILVKICLGKVTLIKGEK